MAKQLIFLSHIHEEKKLATTIQKAIQAEFSGFVEVFVSSDGTSIPAGASFLSRIEDGLTACCAAIYLVSPRSVTRQWINFELGAVWIRNVQSVKAGGAHIPAVPFCHSGMKPSQLPAPLNNLNAIDAAQSSALSFAFQSIQTAVGGAGTLKTDFDALAAEVISFEREYTLGESYKKLFALLKSTPTMLDKVFDLTMDSTTLVCGWVKTDAITAIKGLESNELAGRIKVVVKEGGLMIDDQGGGGPGANLDITVSIAELKSFEKTIRG